MSQISPIQGDKRFQHLGQEYANDTVIISLCVLRWSKEKSFLLGESLVSCSHLDESSYVVATKNHLDKPRITVFSSIRAMLLQVSVKKTSSTTPWTSSLLEQRQLQPPCAGGCSTWPWTPKSKVSSLVDGPRPGQYASINYFIYVSIFLKGMLVHPH